MVAALHLSRSLLWGNGGWMVWNLMLALVPAVLSVVLFRRGTRRTALWWTGVAAFVLFLPNAPYVLTDVIHFVADVRRAPSTASIVFVIVPVYAVFAMVAFGAYVVSLVNMGRYLRSIGWGRWVEAIEVATHAACAVGIWLGRFPHVNSWDLVGRPALIAAELGHAFTHRVPLVVMAMTFVIVAAFYAVAKALVTALTRTDATSAR